MADTTIITKYAHISAKASFFFKGIKSMKQFDFQDYHSWESMQNMHQDLRKDLQSGPSLQGTSERDRKLEEPIYQMTKTCIRAARDATRYTFQTDLTHRGKGAKVIDICPDMLNQEESTSAPRMHKNTSVCCAWHSLNQGSSRHSKAKIDQGLFFFLI